MDEKRMAAADILLVDDERANLVLLERMLARAGYQNVRSTTDPLEALADFLEREPDLLVLDLHMPRLDGFEVMERLRPHLPEDGYLPILVLTGDATVEARHRALAVGAKDFLTKPFDPFEAMLRIRNLLATRILHLELQRHLDVLEERVRERTRELDEAQVEILERLALAAEYRDDQTGAHTRRVAALSGRLALDLGVPAAEAELIARAALLHDVGKIAMPDRIQLKEGPLNTEERSVVEQHARIGATMLSGSRFPVLRLAEQIARTHHERWDGCGYPQRLAGESIPLAGRIVAVADAFDALTHVRPYKKAWTVEKALEELRREAGKHFDPAVVAALDRLVERGEHRYG